MSGMAASSLANNLIVDTLVIIAHWGSVLVIFTVSWNTNYPKYGKNGHAKNHVVTVIFL